MLNKNKELDNGEFKPYGAIAFFICLMVLALIIWFGIYFFMINSVQ